MRLRQNNTRVKQSSRKNQRQKQKSSTVCIKTNQTQKTKGGFMLTNSKTKEGFMLNLTQKNQRRFYVKSNKQ